MERFDATLLTACGSQAAAPSAEAEPTKVETAKAEETELAAPAEVEEVVEAEPTPEPVVYEGIDMESTLPGLEWIATFDEINVDEPIIVVYNDETNKKVIVNEGDEVEFSKSNDTLAFYSPDVNIVDIFATPGGFTEQWAGNTELPDALTSTRVITCLKGITSGDIKLECIAVH